MKTKNEKTQISISFKKKSNVSFDPRIFENWVKFNYQNWKSKKTDLVVRYMGSIGLIFNFQFKNEIEIEEIVNLNFKAKKSM